MSPDDLAEWLDGVSPERLRQILLERRAGAPRCVRPDEVVEGVCAYTWFKEHTPENGGPRWHTCTDHQRKRHKCSCGKQHRAAPRQRASSQSRLEVVA